MTEDRATGPDRRPTGRRCPRCDQSTVPMWTTCPHCGYDLEADDDA